MSVPWIVLHGIPPRFGFTRAAWGIAVEDRGLVLGTVKWIAMMAVVWIRVGVILLTAGVRSFQR